ncbi:hypothetical protein Srufu_018240 [Streptomyces libani subsp. rufus]|nr:hypothetical protein Srufu_018240 [Streptomyces libani subsp. rufus]
MITTDFVPGSPCWLDLGAPDVEAATAFYRAVFGWQPEPHGGQDAGGYTLFRLDGKAVAAVGPLTEAGARSAWTLYFHTPDADASVQAVERAGGSVRVPPAGVGTEDGRFAQLTDPQGADFAVWEPARYPGVEAADGPGTLVWTELYTTDPAAAQTFYKSVFGWSTQDMPLPGGGGTYTLLTPPVAARNGCTAASWASPPTCSAPAESRTGTRSSAARTATPPSAWQPATAAPCRWAPKTPRASAASRSATTLRARSSWY